MRLPTVFALTAMCMIIAMPTFAEERVPLIRFHNHAGGAYGEHGGEGWNAPRYMRPYFEEGNPWAAFIEEVIEPEYEWGVRRWLLHNPFGRSNYGSRDDGTREPMLFDQYLLAPKHDHGWLTKDFEEAWGEFLAEHDDVEVIVYLGKLGGGRWFEQYEGQPDKWLQHALDSIKPLLRLNVSIAFDAVSGAEYGSRRHRFVQLIDSMGVEVYIEAWPRKDRAHMGQFNIVTGERVYVRRTIKGSHGIAPEQAKGEVVRLVSRNLGNPNVLDIDHETLHQPGPLADLMRAIIDDGHTAAVQMDVFQPF